MDNKKKTVEYGKYGILFITPFFVAFLIFQLYPLLNTFVTSLFYNHRVGRAAATVEFGFGNYTNFVFGEGGGGEVWHAIVVTVILWLLNFIPQILLSLLLASWFTDMHNKVKGQGFFKVVMYLPNIITAATIAVLFYNLFDINGPLTVLFRKIGWVGDHGVLDRGWWSLIIIAFIQFWMWYGNTMIVLVAGIMGINPSLYEAAMVDGATPNQQFFSITLPLLKPILQFTMVTSAIGGLQMFDIPQLFNVGGPSVNIGGAMVNSTTTVVMLIKKYVDPGAAQNYGRAAAYSVVLFVITTAVSLIFKKLTDEKD